MKNCQLNALQRVMEKRTESVVLRNKIIYSVLILFL